MATRGYGDMTGAGYYRGTPPQYGGTGSMAGPKGTTTGPAPVDTAWHPTVAYLMALVVFELAAYAGLRYVFRNAHGG